MLACRDPSMTSAYTSTTAIAIHSAELVNERSTPPTEIGTMGWISNCSSGLCSSKAPLAHLSTPMPTALTAPDLGSPVLPLIRHIADPADVPVGIQHSRRRAEEEEDQKQDRPGIEPPVQPIADQGSADDPGHQLDPDLHSGAADRGPPVLLRLLGFWQPRVFSQAAQTLVEVLEVRRSLLARHPAPARCACRPATHTHRRPGRGHNRSVAAPVKLCPDGRAAPAMGNSSPTSRAGRDGAPPPSDTDPKARRPGPPPVRVAWMSNELPAHAHVLSARPGYLVLRLQPVRVLAPCRAALTLPQL